MQKLETKDFEIAELTSSIVQQKEHFSAQLADLQAHMNQHLQEVIPARQHSAALEKHQHLEAVIKEQIDVIARLVKGGERLREKTKQAEMEKEDAVVEVAELRTEVKSVQRYAEVIEERFKERARAEEEANKKVLALIDTVERLEAERLQLMDA